MKGDSEIIEALNETLTAELTAVNQYYVHYKMCENWGLARLAAKFRAESIEEMKHADRVIGRILYLEGIPNMQRLFPVAVGEAVPEQLQLMLETEKQAVLQLNRSVALCVGKGDNGTRELFESILTDEEQGIDWLEAQLDLIRQIGTEHYLAQHIHE